MRPPAVRQAVLLGAVLLFASSSASCDQEANTYVEPPPPVVTVAKPVVETISEYLSFPGRLIASERVEVRARVSGILQKTDFFVPGTDVEAGQQLYQIDPRQYEAQLAAARAQLAEAEANLKRANLEYDRAKRLFEKNAGPETEVVRWEGQKAVAAAKIISAESAIEQAELDIEYTNVKAPISGRVGRNMVDFGNLVGEGEATILTDITKRDPIYAYFYLNEKDLLRVMRLYRERTASTGVDPKKDSAQELAIPVELGLDDEEGHPHKGVYEFAASGLDSESGTIELRASFKNQETPAALIPGLFVRLRMKLWNRPNMVHVSDRAVSFDQGGAYVLTVSDDGSVSRNPVVLGDLIDGLRVIESGVAAEDRVIVKGIQRARSGARVQAEEIDMSTLRISARATREPSPRNNSSAEGEK
jgi:RND family efflux transporter MFP subunit